MKQTTLYRYADSDPWKDTNHYLYYLHRKHEKALQPQYHQTEITWFNEEPLGTTNRGP